MMKQKQKQQQNQRRKKRQPNPSSALSIMGVVLLLCQNSSCALNIQPRASHRSFKSCSTVPILRRDNDRAFVPPLPSPSASSILRFDSSTALYYKNYKVSDDDNDKTTTPAASTTDKQSQSSPSSIPHKHQNDHHISNFFHTLWTSGKTRRAKELHAIQLKEQNDKQQYVLDEYLESIDRRYKRLHEDEESSLSSSTLSPKATHENGGFTNALQWLKHSSDSSTISEIEKQRQKDDAIYVLGLADLASKKLLQRHHLPIPESKKKSFIDVAFQNESLELIKDVILADHHQQQKQKQPDDELVSVLTSPTNFAAAIASYTSATISTMCKVMVIMQVLQQIKVAHYLKNFLSSKVTQNLLSSIRIGGKAFTNVLGLFVSFITNTSGSKYSLQLVSVFAAAIFAFAVSVLRPMISKA